MNCISQKAVIFLLLFWLSASSFSQSTVRIRGRVLDASTGQALSGANVQVVGRGMGAATGSSGRFIIENLLNGDYTLRITFIGYKTVERRVTIRDDEPANLLVRLRPAVIQLPGVQVEAQRSAAQGSDGVIVLTRERIVSAQVQDLGSLLKTVGGLQVVEANGKKTIQIRGARANQTLVLLDGVKLNDPVTGEVDLAQAALHDVERIEIKKGSAAEFGDGALGGVIRIVTFHGREAEQSLSWQGGSYGFQTAAASISRTWHSLTLSASGQSLSNSRRFPYHYTAPNDVRRQEVRRNADVNSVNLFLGAAYRRGDHSADFKLSSFSSDRGTPGKVYYWTPYARVNSRRTVLRAGYRFTKGHWEFSAQGAHTWHMTESSNIRPKEETLPFGSTPEFHFRSRFFADDITGRVHYEPNDYIILTMGVDGRRLTFADENILMPHSAAIGRAEDSSFGVFVKPELHLRFGEVHFTTAPVLRFDVARLMSSSQRDENQFSPGLQLFLSHGSQRQVYLRGEVSRAFRMPTFADLFYQDFRIQGKPDLAPEKSGNAEAAIGFKWFGLLNLYADAAWFVNRIDDMIVWRLGSFEFFRPYNTDALLRGGEYSLQLSSPSDRFGIDLFYSHLKALNKCDDLTLHDKMLPYRPEHSYTVNIRYSGKPWRVSAGLRGAGRRFITESNTKAMPPYRVLDISAEWTLRLPWGDLQWRAAVLNVLDERYEILRDMPLPGREWRVGLTLKSR